MISMYELCRWWASLILVETNEGGKQSHSGIRILVRTRNCKTDDESGLRESGNCRESIEAGDA